MTRRMLIDATHPEETRVTVVNGNRLEEFDYETTTKQQIKGNIYLAKVTRVEPSLQAAFVEYGGNRHGFLAFSEIHPDYYRIPVGDREELVDDEDGDDNGDADGNDGDADGDGSTVEDMGASEGVDEAVEEAARRRPRLRRQYKIQEVIKRRQVMLVQVVKEERGNKGAALTTYLSLAGRYCVVMPNTSRGGGVSRKIANVADRKRLKTILSELEVPEGMAVILRTAGAERSKAEVKRDFDYIMRLWDEIRENTLGSTAPSLIHEEGNLIKRAIRDVYDKDIEEVLVAGDDGYRIAKDFMKALIPSHAKKVQPYKDEQGIPLFHRYQVEQQLALIHEPTVQLRSGGSIVIHQTEALVAIDVNSGKSTRERHIEETALKTNLEAAEEVARQLRLRDLAGLIVIDFIDMDESRNDHAVERRLKEALRRDRARIQVGRISAFGLMEMSRQRLRPSLIEAMSQPCPTCGGVGYIVSTESAALMVTRAIEEEGLRKRASALTVKVPGSVALYVLNHKRSILMDMEERYGFTVTIEAVDGMLPPHYEIQRAGQVDGEEVSVKEERSNDRPARSEQDEERGGRRRSRRGGRRRGRRDDETPREEFDDVDAAEEADDTADDQTDGNADSGDSEDDQNRKRRKRGRRGGRRRNRNRNDENQQDQSAEGASEGEGADDASDDTNGAQSDEAGDSAAQDGGERGKRRRRGRGRGRGRSADAQDGAPQEADSQPESQTDDGTDSEAAPEAASEDVPAMVMASEPEQTEVQAETPAKEAPAKKPRRSRKKAAAAKPEPAEATPEVPAEAAADAVSEPASDAEPAEPKTAKRKPAKKAAAKKARASRKKAAAAKPDAAEPVAADAPVEPEVKPEAQAATAAQPETVTEAAQEPVSEPAAEPETATEASPEPANDQPKKKGWWNRVLG